MGVILPGLVFLTFRVAAVLRMYESAQMRQTGRPLGCPPPHSHIKRCATLWRYVECLEATTPQSLLHRTGIASLGFFDPNRMLSHGFSRKGLRMLGERADFAEIWIDDKLVWRKSDLTDGDPVWRTEYLKLPS
jgi:hypothetical protein